MEDGVGSWAIVVDVEIFVWLQGVGGVADGGAEVWFFLAEWASGCFDVLPYLDVARVFEEGVGGEASREREGECGERNEDCGARRMMSGHVAGSFLLMGEL